MNIWATMITALRGGINEAGEAMVDTQALRILDQEVRDATEALKQSRDNLAGILARQKLAEERGLSAKASIAEFENYAVKALEGGDETLALEIAGKIANLENNAQQEAEIFEEYKNNADKLRKAMRLAEQNIRRLKQQIDTVKATENVQRAQAAVAERYRGSNATLSSAMDSLERIKARQALKAAEIEAAEELFPINEDEALQAKLVAAGIVSAGSRAEDVLNRIKTKNN